jgi:flagellar biosynthesis protein FlhB
MSDDSGEKSFAPSAKRRRDAAQKGDVVRSRDLATAVTALGGVAWLKFAGPGVWHSLSATIRGGLTFDHRAIEQFEPGAVMINALVALLPPVLLLGLLMLLLSGGSQLAFGEGRLLFGNLAPKWSRISPARGLGRMFGTQGLIELGKSVAKLILLGAIARHWLRDQRELAAGLGHGALQSQLAAAWEMLLSLLLALALGLVVIAVIDLPIQLVRRFLRLRMSQQDMRDEHKESEGSPENKAAIRQRQRQIAAGGVQHAMREAQFVITNPTHFAVALAYDPTRASAPIVLAKGQGEKALAMRELAAEFAVPLLEYPALARSVYFTTRENQVIREELYAAVATVLGFVMSLKLSPALPPPPIDVPVALRFDADGRLESGKRADGA